MTAPPLPTNAEYILTNNWATGTDADTEAYNETSYLTRPGVNVTGIGRATHRAYSPPGTPACDFTLPNTDGRYSPGGVLGGFVGRGAETTFAAVWGVDVLMGEPDITMGEPGVLLDGQATVPLFTGNIDTAPQQIDGPTASVSVRSLGRIALVNEQSPKIALWENIRTDQAIALVLDAVGWPAEARELDEGDTDLLYFWANGDTTASDLIARILGAEGVPSCFYEDASGVAHFEGRQWRANNDRSSVAQWHLFDGPAGTHNATMNDQAVLVNDPNVLLDGPLDALLFHVVPSQWSANPDEVVRSVKATVNVRTATNHQKVWEYGGTLTLSANEVRDLEATDSSAPFKSAVVPVADTDYSLSSGALASVTLLETSGQTVRIRLTAGSGGAVILGVTSNGIQLRAVSLPVTTTVTLPSTVDIDLSSARFRPRDHALTPWPEITANQALDLANNFARRYQRPRDQMTVQMVNKDAAHMHAMLNVRISDRVRIRHVRAAIDQEFYVEAMSHALTDGGGLHRLTLTCERVTDDTPARFGEARFGFDQFTE